MMEDKHPSKRVNLEDGSKQSDNSTDDGHNYINDLPDCVLHYIVSFLPTEDMIKTSFLSQRWKYLWTPATVFDFDQKIFIKLIGSPFLLEPLKKVNEFADLIDRTLLLHETATIKKFRLCFGSANLFSSRISQWIKYAVRHEVEEMDLDFQFSSYRLPDFLFRYGESLRVLKLSYIHDSTPYNGRAFTSLEHLSLTSVNFADGSIQCLIDNCPLLQVLNVKDCYSGKALKISAPNLKQLRIYSYRSASSWVVAQTPKLESLMYSGFMGNLILLSSFCATNVVLDLDMYHVRQADENEILELLSDLHHVKALTLSSVLVEAISNMQLESLPDPLPNLKHITILYNFLHMDIKGMEEEGNALARGIDCLRKSSPNLESTSKQWTEGVRRELAKEF